MAARLLPRPHDVQSAPSESTALGSARKTRLGIGSLDWPRLIIWLVAVGGMLVGLLPPGTWLPRDEITLTRPLGRDGRFGFTARTPFHLEHLPTDMAVRTDLEILENGRPLGPSQAPRWKVQDVGRGAFRHDEQVIIFSSSDGSDPNRNGRQYRVTYPRSVPIPLLALAYTAATGLLVGGGLLALRLARRFAGVRGDRYAWGVVEPLLALAGLTCAAFAYPQIVIFMSHELSTVIHVTFAEEIARTGVLWPSHFVYHLAVVVAHLFMPGRFWMDTGLVTVFAFYLMLAGTLWYAIRGALGRSEGDHHPYFAPLLAAGLLVVAPITMPTWPERNLYFGYVLSHQLWSQTMIALKPFAVLAFLLAGRVFDPSHPDRRSAVIAALAASAALSTLAKPSFIVCLLPALGLFLLPRLLARRFDDLVVYVGALAVPNVALLLWQYVQTYLQLQGMTASDAASGSGTGVFIAPFLVMGFYSQHFHPGLWWLLPKFLLSIAFPLLVTALYFRQAGRDWRLLVAWLMFGFGCFSAYFVAEVAGAHNGNFTWSAQITLFVLFVAAALFFVESVVRPSRDTWRSLLTDRRAAACTLALILHVVGGVYHLAHPLSV